LIDSHDFGSLTEGKPESETLTGTYVPAATGLYTLEIENTRGTTSITDVMNFIDTIVLAPTEPMLGADSQTFSVFFGGTCNMDLTAGSAHANRDYWMWMGYSGTFPGIQLGGVTIPLNYDLLVQIGLNYPGFANPDFVGQLDGSGNAAITMKLKPDAALMDLTLYFAYVVLSSGGALPVLAASNPINATVTLYY
jgi:hypothetical protein